jgi:photosystem II stability/assembly factor-like uncharacterized protein
MAFMQQEVPYTRPGASGAIYKSVNEGTTFSRYSPIYREIKNITFADDNTAYALVINGDIYESTDAGNTWHSNIRSQAHIIVQ